MRFLIDFTPILLFFGAYKLYDIYTATAVIMAATVLQCLLIYKLDGKLPMMQKITLLLIVVFGSMTLFFHDERFIKWKPTVLYGALAVGLSVALWVMHKNFLKLLLGSQLTLPDAVWMRLNKAWIVYCIFMSVLNGYVAAQFSTEDWVNFKIWGYVFPIAFIVGQGLYMARYLKDTSDVKETGHE